MPSAGTAALFWRMSVPFLSEGGRVFAGRREGMTIAGRRERRKGKGHDPQARGRGVRGRGVLFPRPRRLFCVGQQVVPEAFSRPRGIAARRPCRSACIGLSQSVVMSVIPDAPGLPSSGGAGSRASDAEISCAKVKLVDCRKTPENAPLRSIRLRKANVAGSIKKLLSHACGRSRYQAPWRIRCSGRAFFLLRTDRRPSSPPPR